MNPPPDQGGWVTPRVPRKLSLRNFMGMGSLVIFFATFYYAKKQGEGGSGASTLPFPIFKATTYQSRGFNYKLAFALAMDFWTVSLAVPPKTFLAFTELSTDK